MKQKCNFSVVQNPLAKGRQLSLPLALDRNQQKPQIVSVPGISPKQRDRYRLMRGDEVLADFLSLDEAIALVKGGAK